MEGQGTGSSPGESREEEKAGTHFQEEGSGANVLFVHDWLETSLAFVPLSDALGPQYRKVRMDLPGFGKTLPPEGFDYSLGSYGMYLQGALREASIRDGTLVLHGFGVLVGLDAIRRGGEAARRIYRVVILNGPLYNEVPGRFAFLTGRGPFEELQRPPPYDLPSYRRAALGRFGDPTYFDDTHIQELYRSWRPRGRETLRQLAAELGSFRTALPKLRQGLQEWGGPVHVLWGEDDDLLGSEMPGRLEQEVPRAKALLFPDVGHLPHLEAPQALADEMRKFVRVGAPARREGGRPD